MIFENFQPPMSDFGASMGIYVVCFSPISDSTNFRALETYCRGLHLTIT